MSHTGARSKIVIGCDHGGFLLKEKIIHYLNKQGLLIEDIGTFSQGSMDYPDTAYKVARAVSFGKAHRGILICKTGIGNCIVANKLKNVRAALCYNIKAARLSRRHNDANVLVLGALFVTSPAAKKMIDAWLNTAFEGGRHLRRIKKIERIERLCARQ
ncbi:MAG: ribose 5-phosphate isomerase B [Candidatus Omnitrophica bacterium CG1_02_44_16]|nr:MAG: ribose 5-phosphate isomerase B [Candidatus Omnitrophica bacterium CG1_02_44_16]PIY83376.1 MAG: ribose 5-phosphate isomerase B [Candidatus Omnitrophica bacterium CG_4_10_14_0_8_um_filter_44_12]PIZ84338.1 MAG: ribose 5-phosphate isomerase B [Candidatus Omnitrophica bacterium CG_4_10_14_0_2_um_filter_44_9]